MAILSRLHKDVLSVQPVQLSFDPADVMAQKRPVEPPGWEPAWRCVLNQVLAGASSFRRAGETRREGGRLNNLSVVGASLGVSSLDEAASVSTTLRCSTGWVLPLKWGFWSRIWPLLWEPPVELCVVGAPPS